MNRGPAGTWRRFGRNSGKGFMPTCRKCNQDKPEEAMKKEKRSPRQRPICKECHNASYRAYAASNRAKVRKQKIQSNAKHRLELRARARDKASTPEAKAKKAEQRHKYYFANKNKYRAWRLVGEAVESGRLIRPTHCERCGSTGCAIEGSHDDYSRPLDVEWLCTSCHRSKDWAATAATNSS